MPSEILEGQVPNWTWQSAPQRERAEFVRRHPGYLCSKEWICEHFSLTPDGADKILAGDDWRPEYSTAPDGLQMEDERR